VKPAPFSYHDPDRIEEVLALLGRLENARLLAGGQSLMPMLNMRYAQPDHLIDLGRVEGLDGLTENAEALVCGAMVRQRTLEFSGIVRRRLPILHEALLEVGHRQTRNRGTLGGSLCHLDPAAELVTIASALDAEVTIRGPDGERKVPFAEFPLGFMTPCLAPEEMLTEVRLPFWPAGHGYGFVEFARRHGDFAIASAAALVLRDGAGRIARAALVLGGIAAAPVRPRAAERALVGSRGEEAVIRDVGALSREVEAMGDALVPASYRRRLAGVMAERALRRALASAE